MPLLDSLGVGVDVQEVAAFVDHGDPRDARFYERVFSAAEREYCLASASPAEHFAGRFAAKEAVVKAMSRFQSLCVEEVEVVRAEGGLPRARLSIDAAADYRLELSLSHSETHAVAVCLAERVR